MGSKRDSQKENSKVGGNTNKLCENSDFYTTLSVTHKDNNVVIDMWDVLEVVQKVTNVFEAECSRFGPSGDGTQQHPFAPTTSQEWYRATQTQIVQQEGLKYSATTPGVFIKFGTLIVKFDFSKRYAHFDRHAVEEDVTINGTTLHYSTVLPLVKTIVPEEISIGGINFRSESLEPALNRWSQKLTKKTDFIQTILQNVFVPPNIRAIAKFATANPGIFPTTESAESNRTAYAKSWIDRYIAPLLILAVFLMRSFVSEPKGGGLTYVDLAKYLELNMVEIRRSVSILATRDELEKNMSLPIFKGVSGQSFFTFAFNWLLWCDGKAVLSHMYDKIAQTAAEANTDALFTSDIALVAEMRSILRGEDADVSEAYVPIIVAAWVGAESSRFSMNYIATFCLMDCIECKVLCPNQREECYTIANSLYIPADMQKRFVDAHGHEYTDKSSVKEYDLARIRGYHPMVHFTSYLQTNVYTNNSPIPTILPIAMQKTACIVMQWFALCLQQSSEYELVFESVAINTRNNSTRKQKSCVLDLLEQLLLVRIRSLDKFADFELAAANMLRKL